MKVFKTYGAAKRYANGGHLVRVGKLYLAAPELDPVSFGLTSVDLLDGNGNSAATVTLRHLERLGNANYAERAPKSDYGIFAKKIFDAVSPNVKAKWTAEDSEHSANAAYQANNPEDEPATGYEADQSEVYPGQNAWKREQT